MIQILGDEFIDRDESRINAAGVFKADFVCTMDI
jgi:hypothetical protein